MSNVCICDGMLILFFFCTDFPVHLGVNISCVTPEETTRTGHKYAMTALANSHTTYPLVVHEASENSDGIEWRSRYPAYNSSNLDKHGVLQVEGQPFIFCDQNHPVVELLRQNREMLNANIDDQPLIDGTWLKITKQVFGTCCKTLQNRVLNKVQTRDLNNFSVQITRLGRDDWTPTFSQNDEIMTMLPTEVLLSEDPKAVTESMTGILKKPCTYSALLQIEYDIHA